MTTFSSIGPPLTRASCNLDTEPVYISWHIVLPQATSGTVTASIFAFLESLDKLTDTFFVGAPNTTMLPLLLYNASMSGNCRVLSITVLILLMPPLLFMVMIHKFMYPGMIAKLEK